MNSSGGRRWLRFSLRSLLLAMTVVAGWLGWETSVVRHRQAVLKELQGNASFQISTADDWTKRFPPGGPVDKIASVSPLRAWLGDVAIQEVWYTRHTHGFSAPLLARLERAFPEARVYETHPEPCHPGCFPHGTLVDTPQGPRVIEQVAIGDTLVVILPSGAPATARVQTVFTTTNRLWRIDTAAGILWTTATQPLCVSAERTVPAGELRPADTLLVLRDGIVAPTAVLAAAPTARTERVVNLVLGDSEIFVANGFLARSKPPAEVAAR